MVLSHGPRPTTQASGLHGAWGQLEDSVRPTPPRRMVNQLTLTILTVMAEIRCLPRRSVGVSGQAAGASGWGASLESKPGGRGDEEGSPASVASCARRRHLEPQREPSEDVIYGVSG